MHLPVLLAATGVTAVVGAALAVAVAALVGERGFSPLAAALFDLLLSSTLGCWNVA